MCDSEFYYAIDKCTIKIFKKDKASEFIIDFSIINQDFEIFDITPLNFKRNLLLISLTNKNLKNSCICVFNANSNLFQNLININGLITCINEIEYVDTKFFKSNIIYLIYSTITLQHEMQISLIYISLNSLITYNNYKELISKMENPNIIEEYIPSYNFINDNKNSDKLPKISLDLAIVKGLIYVSCLEYCPSIDCLLCGFSNGNFEIWNLVPLHLLYENTWEAVGDVPLHCFVSHASFQEPENDPVAFYYVWVARQTISAPYGPSNRDLKGGNPKFTLYQLRFKTKSTDPSPITYKEFVECRPCLTIDSGNISSLLFAGTRVDGNTENIRILDLVAHPDYCSPKNIKISSDLNVPIPKNNNHEYDSNLTFIVLELICPRLVKTPFKSAKRKITDDETGLMNSSFIAVFAFDMNAWYAAKMPSALTIRISHLPPFLMKKQLKIQDEPGCYGFYDGGTTLTPYLCGFLGKADLEKKLVLTLKNSKRLKTVSTASRTLLPSNSSFLLPTHPNRVRLILNHWNFSNKLCEGLSFSLSITPNSSLSIMLRRVSPFQNFWKCLYECSSLIGPLNPLTNPAPFYRWAVALFDLPSEDDCSPHRIEKSIFDIENLAKNIENGEIDREKCRQISVLLDLSDKFDMDVWVLGSLKHSSNLSCLSSIHSHFISRISRLLHFSLEGSRTFLPAVALIDKIFNSLDIFSSSLSHARCAESRISNVLQRIWAIVGWAALNGICPRTSGVEAFLDTLRSPFILPPYSSSLNAPSMTTQSINHSNLILSQYSMSRFLTRLLSSHFANVHMSVPRIFAAHLTWELCFIFSANRIPSRLFIPCLINADIDSIVKLDVFTRFQSQLPNNYFNVYGCLSGLTLLLWVVFHEYRSVELKKTVNQILASMETRAVDRAKAIYEFKDHNAIENFSNFVAAPADPDNLFVETIISLFGRGSQKRLYTRMLKLDLTHEAFRLFHLWPLPLIPYKNAVLFCTLLLTNNRVQSAVNFCIEWSAINSSPSPAVAVITESYDPTVNKRKLRMIRALYNHLFKGLAYLGKLFPDLRNQFSYTAETRIDDQLHVLAEQLKLFSARLGVENIFNQYHEFGSKNECFVALGDHLHSPDVSQSDLNHKNGNITEYDNDNQIPNVLLTGQKNAASISILRDILSRLGASVKRPLRRLTLNCGSTQDWRLSLNYSGLDLTPNNGNKEPSNREKLKCRGIFWNSDDIDKSYSPKTSETPFSYFSPENTSSVFFQDSRQKSNAKHPNEKLPRSIASHPNSSLVKISSDLIKTDPIPGENFAQFWDRIITHNQLIPSAITPDQLNPRMNLPLNFTNPLSRMKLNSMKNVAGFQSPKSILKVNSCSTPNIIDAPFDSVEISANERKAAKVIRFDFTSLDNPPQDHGVPEEMHYNNDIIEKDVKGGGDYNVSTRPPLNANPPCLSYRETEVTSSKTPNLPLLKTNFHDFFSGGDPACLISGDKTKVTTRFVAEEKNIMFAPEATNYYSMVTPRKRLSDIRDENKSNLN
ncbi:uncharacterized protein LOC135922643 isoform X2 [Gordionus sp. m RMFG-2023]|uniref:uncharacterized protein LOC135922643 isoform X2 n=1 Tax=Gordionus sp. m RMFG-2023 TaxID=3053472 RepID=UPI0031FCBBF7